MNFEEFTENRRGRDSIYLIVDNYRAQERDAHHSAVNHVKIADGVITVLLVAICCLSIFLITGHYVEYIQNFSQTQERINREPGVAVIFLGISIVLCGTLTCVYFIKKISKEMVFSMETSFRDRDSALDRFVDKIPYK